MAYYTRRFMQKRNTECHELSEGNPPLSTEAITRRLSDMKKNPWKASLTVIHMRWNGKLDGRKLN